MFTIVKKERQSWARVGMIETAHGTIETPAYAIVGTHGYVRCLPSVLLPSSQTKLVISNTYHLWQDFKGSRGEIDALPTVHQLLGQNLPIMTDSGGFQVFSLGFSREHGIGKVSSIFPEKNDPPLAYSPEKNLVRITEEGAFFKTSADRPEEFLGPELSIKIQEKLGADIILAFDECTSPLHPHQYTKEALDRTHRWAKICLEVKTSRQKLYGIVQGGEFEDLRKASAHLINSWPFDGIAIGGSLGRSRSGAFEILKWIIPILDENRPRHFLGIGRIEDLLDGVEHGIDTFDCVIPTREARHGRIWTSSGHFDLTKGHYARDFSPLEKDCACPTCQSTTKAQLRQLFKDKNPLAGQWATLHNVFFFNRLMKEIREAIKQNCWPAFKRQVLSSLKQNSS